MRVMWFSTGISSAIACMLAEDVDEIIYTHVEDQHPDSLRFLHDVEDLLHRKITILQSERYKNVEDVIRKTRYINGPSGAACTTRLKKEVRKKWEREHPGFHTYIWGFDCDEVKRARNLEKAMSGYEHEFPLIDHQLSKADCLALAEKCKLRRPLMYTLGYPNNNCIGCIKASKGYWNRIRRDFPEVFESRAKLEREIGHSCMNGCFLDELDPDSGDSNIEVFPECSIMCHLTAHKL